LAALAKVWAEQKSLLANSDSFHEFNLRLQRQWAIETGVIERVYSLDRGITELLIERGIDSIPIPTDATDQDPELVALIIRDHQEAIDGLFSFVSGSRSLSASYVKELHAVMTRHQESSLAVNQFGRQFQAPLLRGQYKQLPNNPVRPDGTIHEYCPPEQVTSEMDRLIELHRLHEEEQVPPEVEAAWFHHRFSQIHPFQDGNGRVARALASLIFIKAGWFPLVVTRDDRERYISALESADQDHLVPLVDQFASLERRAFVNALSVAGDVLRRERVDQVIEAARDTYEKREEALRHEWQKAIDIAKTLHNDALSRMEEVVSKLQDELGHFSGGYHFWVTSEAPEGDRGHWFRWQVVETAKRLNYFANPSLFHAWNRMGLRTESQSEILVSFHGIGREFRGVLVASACFFRREQTESGEREIADVTPVATSVFQINYHDELDEVRKRFETWLEEALTRGLEAWRMGI
jgi:Fic family protein